MCSNIANSYRLCCLKGLHVQVMFCGDVRKLYDTWSERSVGILDTAATIDLLSSPKGAKPKGFSHFFE